MNVKKIIIVASIVALAGVGGYFGYQWYKKNKKKKEDDGGSGSKESESNSKSSTPSMTINTSAPVVATGKSTSAPAATDKPANVLDFQKYANKQGAKLAEDGAWGPMTEAAWGKYGTAYKNTLKNVAAQSQARFKKGEAVVPIADIPNRAKYRVVDGKYKETGISETIPEGTRLTVVSSFSSGGGVAYMVNIYPYTSAFYVISESNLKLA